MRFKLKRGGLLLLGCGFSGLALALKIQLFSVSTLAFYHVPPHVTPCYLDQAATAKQQLLAQVQQTPALLQNAPSLSVQQLLQQISEGAVCEVKAKQLGVTQLPAVVFNQRFVVLGVHDVAKAQALWQHWQAEQGGRA